MMRLPCLLMLCVLGVCGFHGTDAIRIDILPENCIQDFSLQWTVARFGPLNICINGTVLFRWVGLHGIFQIPDIACPSNFTAPKADNYAFLASVNNGGSFSWEVPNKTGQYWITSQAPGDCQNGMIAEVYVTDPTSNAIRQAAMSFVVMAAAMIMTVAVSI